MQMAVPGHGSQSTVVLMDGQGQGRGPVDPSRNNQQEQKRQREEEISRKRREEQEGIARRQYESEEAARAARQNLASPNLPYSPNSSTSSTNAQQPFSLFPTHLGASSSTVPKSMFYPTAVQYPKLGPTASRSRALITKEIQRIRNHFIKIFDDLEWILMVRGLH